MPINVLGPLRSRHVPTLSDLIHLRRRERDLPASRRVREQFAETYAKAVSRIPQILEVRIRDNIRCLDVFTFYEGDIHSFEDDIYEIEATVADTFPDVRVDWHVVRAEEISGNLANTRDARILATR